MSTAEMESKSNSPQPATHSAGNSLALRMRTAIVNKADENFKVEQAWLRWWDEVIHADNEILIRQPVQTVAVWVRLFVVFDAP